MSAVRPLRASPCRTRCTSPVPAAASWSRNVCASVPTVSSADCAAWRRAPTVPLLSIMAARRVYSWRSETVWPVLAPRLAPTSAWRPVDTSFCASTSCACSLASDWRIAPETALVDVNVVFMSLADGRQQRTEHVVDGGDEPARGLVGSLQLQEERHLLVEVDAGDAGERVGGALEQGGLVVRLLARRLARGLEPAYRRGREAGQGGCGAYAGRRVEDALLVERGDELVEPVGEARGAGRIVEVGGVARDGAVAQLGRIAALRRVDAGADRDRAGDPHLDRAGRRHRRCTAPGEETGNVGQRRRSALVALGEGFDEAARDLVELRLVGDGDVVAHLREGGDAARGRAEGRAAGHRHSVDEDGRPGRAGLVELGGRKGNRPRLRIEQSEPVIGVDRHVVVG